MSCRLCGLFKLPGSRPFARSPTLSMPAEFARRVAVNGIPAQSTTFLPASLPASPEASFAAISECGHDNTIYVQFQCARTWSDAPLLTNWRGYEAAAIADKLARLRSR